MQFLAVKDNLDKRIYIYIFFLFQYSQFKKKSRAAVIFFLARLYFISTSNISHASGLTFLGRASTSQFFLMSYQSPRIFREYGDLYSQRLERTIRIRPCFLRIQLKLNTALLSTVRPSVRPCVRHRRDISHFSHI